MIDETVTVEFTGERVRTVVRDVMKNGHIVVELINLPMSKTHDFKQGNFVECEKQTDALGSKWVGLHRMNMKLEEKKEEKKDVRTRKSYKQ